MKRNKDLFSDIVNVNLNHAIDSQAISRFIKSGYKASV